MSFQVVRQYVNQWHLVLEFRGMFDLFREELPVPVLADRDGVGLSDRWHLGPLCPFLSSITLHWPAAGSVDGWLS
jgi:hypothetical protein